MWESWDHVGMKMTHQWKSFYANSHLSLHSHVLMSCQLNESLIFKEENGCDIYLRHMHVACWYHRNKTSWFKLRPVCLLLQLYGCQLDNCNREKCLKSGSAAYEGLVDFSPWHLCLCLPFSACQFITQTPSSLSHNKAWGTCWADYMLLCQGQCSGVCFSGLHISKYPWVPFA